MKKLIAIAMAALLCVLGVFAVSAAEADDIVANLMPEANNNNGVVTLTDCTAVYNADGTVVFTITGSSPAVLIEYKKDGTVYNEAQFKPAEGAKAVYDFGSADGAAVEGGTIIHYTRKDKGDASADLYFSSMVSADYATYKKASGDGYCIWDLGQYIIKEKGEKGLFEDGIHAVVDTSMRLSGPVGSSVTLYRLYITKADSVEGIGTVRPTVTDVSEVEASEAEVSEAEVSEAVSEAEVSEAVSEAEVSEAVSEAEASVPANDSSAPAADDKSEAQDESAADGSVADESQAEAKEGGTPVIWILVGVVAAAVIVAVVVVVTKKKK